MRRATAAALICLMAACGPGRQVQQGNELLRAGRVESARRLSVRLARWYPRDTGVLALAVRVAASERRFAASTDAYRRYYAWAGNHSQELLTAMLLAAFYDSEEEVVTYAVRAGGILSLDTAYESIRQATFDGHPAVRSEAYEAYGRFPLADTGRNRLAALGWMWAAYIEEPEWGVRASIIDAGARLGDTSSLELSRIGYLEQNDFVIWRYIRMRAELGDRKMQARVRDELHGDYDVLQTEAAYTLARTGDSAALQRLARGLGSRDATARGAAAAFLGELRAVGFIDAVLGAASDMSPGVRLRSAYALGEMGAPSGAPALLALLRDSDAQVRAEAALALARLAPPEAESHLVQMLADRKPAVRVAAVAGLMALPGQNAGAAART